MKLSIKELESYVATLLSKDLIANGTFTATKNNIVGLLDKVGKITTLDQNFVDLLPELDGEFLAYGKIVEEYHEDLIMPEAFDRQGSGALTYKESSYRPVSYSYPIAKQKISMSIPNDDIERAVNDGEEFARIIAIKHKRLTDSESLLKFQLKKELLGKYAQLAIDEMSDENPEFDYQTDYDVNTCLVDSEKTPTKHGIMVKPYDASEVEGVTDWASAVAKGYIIEINLIEEIAKPVDTETGEAFIESAKKLVERLGENGEGDSLNGNVLGAQNTLMMYILHGIIPNLEVQTQAGAFQIGKLTLPTPIKALKDFGALSKDYFAMVIDTRGVKLHPNYKAIRENLNGDGDFLNIFMHLGFTPYASRNTAIHLFKVPSASNVKKVVETKAKAKKESK